jgi:hypothetical protein
VDRAVQILVVLRYLRRLQPEAELVVASGNHDSDRQNGAGEWEAGWLRRARRLGVRVDGDWFDRDGWRFTVCPWWDGPESCGRVEELLEASRPADPSRWIWVYHVPPDRTPVSWTGKAWFGDERLTEWIGRHRPFLVLSGHVHQAPFAKGGSWVVREGDTWVLNAGRHSGPWPPHVQIDLEAGTATWISLAGEETERLYPETVESPG